LAFSFSSPSPFLFLSPLSYPQLEAPHSAFFSSPPPQPPPPPPPRGHQYNFHFFSSFSFPLLRRDFVRGEVSIREVFFTFQDIVGFSFFFFQRGRGALSFETKYPFLPCSCAPSSYFLSFKKIEFLQESVDSFAPNQDFRASPPIFVLLCVSFWSHTGCRASFFSETSLPLIRTSLF